MPANPSLQELKQKNAAGTLTNRERTYFQQHFPGQYQQQEKSGQGLVAKKRFDFYDVRDALHKGTITPEQRQWMQQHYPKHYAKNIQNVNLRNMEEQAEAAKQANIQRYEDILGKYGELTGPALQTLPTLPEYFEGMSKEYQDRTRDLSSLLKGFGDVQREDLDRSRQRRESSALQELINRGLTATTIGQDVARGLESDYQKASRDLEDQLTRQQMEYLGGLTGQELAARTAMPGTMLGTVGQAFGMGEQPLAFMERRQDVGPTMQDVGQFAGLMGQAYAKQPNYAQAVKQNDPSNLGTLGKIGGFLSAIF